MELLEQRTDALRVSGHDRGCERLNVIPHPSEDKSSKLRLARLSLQHLPDCAPGEPAELSHLVDRAALAILSDCAYPTIILESVEQTPGVELIKRRQGRVLAIRQIGFAHQLHGGQLKSASLSLLIEASQDGEVAVPVIGLRESEESEAMLIRSLAHRQILSRVWVGGSVSIPEFNDEDMDSSEASELVQALCGPSPKYKKQEGEAVGARREETTPYLLEILRSALCGPESYLEELGG